VAIRQVQAKQIQRTVIANESKPPFPFYLPGDKVLKHNPNYDRGVSQKIQRPWLPGHEVVDTDIPSKANVRIKNTDTGKIETLHKSRIKPHPAPFIAKPRPIKVVRSSRISLRKPKSKRPQQIDRSPDVPLSSTVTSRGRTTSVPARFRMSGTSS
jgi:hypothetical protein